MYAGQIIELAATNVLFNDPKHPYSQGLLQAFPSIVGPKRQLLGIPGSPPDLRRLPSGCRFHPRCPFVMERCMVSEPAEIRLPTHDLVRCHLYAGDQVSGAQPPQEQAVTP